MTDHYSEQGQDFEESMRAIAREREFAKSLGIDLNFSMSPVIANEEEDKPKGNSDKDEKQKAIAL